MDRAPDQATHLAMWSGPRNISTAMMRSWGAREDTWPVDEPFYAAYLHRTGLDHPARGQVLAAQPTNWQTVVQKLLALDKAPIIYAKHMAHHMLPEMLGDWLVPMRHALLVRHPARVVASLRRVLPAAEFDATGYGEQLMIARWLGDRELDFAVVDTDEVLTDPPAAIRTLCQQLGVPFDPAMLSWSEGPRPEDGVWAPHWYDAVYASTGFEPPAPMPDVAPENEALVDECMPYYEALRGQ